MFLYSYINTHTHTLTKFNIVILCPYVSHPQLSQPDCQGTSGPNKVCVCLCACVRVCACPFAMQPFSLAFCRSGVESFTATHCFTTQSLYFKLSGNSACALVRLCSDSSYKKPQLIFCLCIFQGLLICCNTADFPALMLIAGEDLI